MTSSGLLSTSGRSEKGRLQRMVDVKTEEPYDCDVCVVGAGPAGLTVAGELLKAGVDVRVLESGGQERIKAPDPLAGGESVGYPYHRLEKSRARGVGGSSLAWFTLMRARPLDAIDFEQRSGVPGSGWPFGLKQLWSYYERAHEILPLGPCEYGPEFWEEEGKPRLHFPSGEFDTTVFQFGQGEVVSESYRSIARALGQRVMTNVTVVELVTDDEGLSVDHVRVARPDGLRFSLRARTFVLAAGGIANPCLMLMNAGRWRNGIGNEHDLVGRFFMEHLAVHSSFIVPEPDSKWNGSALYKLHEVRGTKIRFALKVSDQRQREEGLLNCSITPEPTDDMRASDMYGSMAALSWRGFRPGRWPLNFYVEDLRNVVSHPIQATSTVVGLFNKSFPRRRRVLRLDLVTEQIPNRDSRVTLSEQQDRFGMRQAKLHWQLTDLDWWSIRRTQEILQESLIDTRLGKLEHLLGEEKPAVRAYGQRHHIGTTRMHVDSKKGVVDEHCRVHGVKNLYIAGSSVFPTSGSANPTLTITALALKLSDHLAQRATLGA